MPRLISAPIPAKIAADMIGRPMRLSQLGILMTSGIVGFLIDLVGLVALAGPASW